MTKYNCVLALFPLKLLILVGAWCRLLVDYAAAPSMHIITKSLTQKHMLNMIKFCKQLIRNVKTTRISQSCQKCWNCKQTGLNPQFSTSIFQHQFFPKIHTKTLTYITHQCYTGVFSTKNESSQ